MLSSEIIELFFLTVLFVGVFGFLYVVISIVNCKYNTENNNTETKTIIKEQPIIIKIEGGYIQQAPELVDISKNSSKKEEVHDLFVEDNPMLKNKKIEDIKVETSFSNGKRIGQKK